jgi:RHS repeat-associated protein
VSYTVDPLNRQSVTDNGAVVGYAPTALNQYGSVGGKTLEYDGNFNLYRYSGVKFDYCDAQNRLLTASVIGGTLLDFSTGLNDAGAPIADGAADSHWSLARPGGGGGSSAYVTNQSWPIPPWLVDTAASKWISPIAAESRASDVPGNYTYTRTFQVGGATHGLQISGRISADDQVVSASLNGQPISVGWSSFGNWTSIAVTSGFRSGTNVLQFVVSNAGPNPNPSGFRAELTLSQAAGSASFIYDGLGRCVKRTINSVTTLLTYDGWNPILEWDQNGNFRAWNIYGARPDEILARYDTVYGGLIYKHDRMGNVIALLDTAGNIVEKYNYDAFGYPTITDVWWNQRNESAYGNRFMFTGREWIKELGIYDYRNRYYHPGLGRFLQSDPTGFDAGDMNLFRYCGDDPVDRADPMGLDYGPFDSADQAYRFFDAKFNNRSINENREYRVEIYQGKGTNKYYTTNAVAGDRHQTAPVPINVARDLYTYVGPGHSHGNWSTGYTDKNGVTHVTGVAREPRLDNFRSQRPSPKDEALAKKETVYTSTPARTGWRQGPGDKQPQPISTRDRNDRPVESYKPLDAKEIEKQEQRASERPGASSDGTSGSDPAPSARP